MNKRYLLLAGIIIALGVGILFMPAKDTSKQTQPELLLAAIDDPSRFLSTDDITDRLVKKDPALMVIDVRSESQFKAFSIPGAINIPADSLLSASAQEILNQKEMDKVFYSNADVTSDQAWIICKRMGMQRIYVMQGGVNKWFNTIVKAEKPAEAAPIEAMELYQFRIAACQYFFGSPLMASTPKVAADKKKVSVVKKKSEAASGGGC
ncbi:MAG: rhodanese-like domain-containing protein [Bacteroidales bacterium]|nr:rhodanese-like domain-containing protein [Bacteroidales bacterium]